jgi:hypothetical protein
MTAGELIELLANYPSDMRVVYVTMSGWVGDLPVPQYSQAHRVTDTQETGHEPVIVIARGTL